MKNDNHILLTGDRPTGKLHLGHLVGSLLQRVELQNDSLYTDRFILIADVQALASSGGKIPTLQKNIEDIVLDYLSVGIDPEKTTICVQSSLPTIAELAFYFMNLVSVAQLQHNPTIKTEMKEKGFGDSVPIGFLAHPVHQAADILSFGAGYVPVGEDQKPLIEQTNDIIRKFNSLYGEVFSPVSALISSNPRLVGIDGKRKMSKSLGNSILLSDPKETVERKVMSMYTDPSHVRVSDPGNVEGNVVFLYLDVFGDSDEVEELKRQYRKGGVGDISIKKKLIDALEKHLAPFREKRALLEKEKDLVSSIISEGNKKASIYTENIMQKVRKKIGVSI